MHWAVLLSIPLTAAAVGVAARVLAIVLLFKPRQFVGMGRLGWQGAVPRAARELAVVNADLIIGRLLETHQLFADVEAERLRAEVEQPLLQAIDTVARDTLAKHHSGVWEALPAFAQDVVIKRLQGAAPWLVRELVTRLRANTDWLIDVRHIVVQRLSDPERMSKLTYRMSWPDLRSSVWFALGFGASAGALEAVVLALTEWPSLLPVCGAAIAAGSCWAAGELIYGPRGQARRRRAEVAGVYAELIAEEVLTPAVLIDALTDGVERMRVRAVIAGVVDELVDEQVRSFRRLVTATIGTDRLPQMKRTAAALAQKALPYTARPAHRYLADKMAVEKTVRHGVGELTDAEYELLTRPALQAGRVRLLVLSATLGAAVGFAQMLLPIG